VIETRQSTAPQPEQLPSTYPPRTYSTTDAAEVLAANRIDTPEMSTSRPDLKRYLDAWDWDGILALVGYSITDPEFAKSVLCYLAQDYQTYPWGRQITLTERAGWIERNIAFPFLRGSNQHDGVDAWTQQPIAGIGMLNAIRNLDKHGGWKDDAERETVLEGVITGLESRYSYLLTNLTDPEDGLPFAIHPYEVGTDAGPNSFEGMGLEPQDTPTFAVATTQLAILNRIFEHDRQEILTYMKENGPIIDRPKILEILGKVAPKALNIAQKAMELVGKDKQKADLHDYAESIKIIIGNPPKLYAQKHVMFAATAAASMDSISKLHEMLGNLEKSRLWSSHARTMWENIFSKMYDRDNGIFKGLVAVQSKSRNGIDWEMSEYETASGFTPLLCPHQDLIDKYGINPHEMLNKATDAQQFMGAAGINYISQKHATRLNGPEEPLWRNTFFSWPPANYLVWEAALTQGEEGKAETIASGFTSAVENAGFWEQHCGVTGAGLRTKNFSWTAAVYLEMKNQLEHQEL